MITSHKALYILFFLEMLIGIRRNKQSDKNINDSIFLSVNENIIKNRTNIGKPMYKSVNSINLPNVFFIELIVIYMFITFYSYNICHFR